MFPASTTGIGSRPAPPPHGRLRGRAVAAIGLGVLTVLLVLLAMAVVPGLLRRTPEFPSLRGTPDTSLHGTVAYTDFSTNCVRLIAASGATTKDVWCIPGQDTEEAAAKGKEIGPQLVWRDDGRLEITMFRMTDPPGPDYRPGWQKLVDVRTGAIEDVPAADVPSSPNLTSRPTVDPTGRRIVTTSDNGDVTISLEDSSGTRTLLSVSGPPDYTYGLCAAFWSPDFRWIAADDGRILVLTPDTDPAATRELTAEAVGGAFGCDDARLSRFAVTSTDLL